MQKRIREQHLGVKGTKRLILTEMLKQADKDRCVSLSRSELAKRANCSDGTVRKAYRLFQEHGLLLLEREGTGRDNLYLEVHRGLELRGMQGSLSGLPWLAPLGRTKRPPQGSLSVPPIIKIIFRRTARKKKKRKSPRARARVRVPVKILLVILLMMTPTVFFLPLAPWHGHARTHERRSRTACCRIYYWNLQRATLGSRTACTGTRI